MDKCYFCKGKIARENVKVDFWWGEELFLIENVPAEVCQQCGERYYNSDVSKKLDAIVQGEGKIRKSIQVPIVEYTAV